MTFRRTGCVHILGTIIAKAMHISNYWKSMCPCLCYDIIRYLADILQISCSIISCGANIRMDLPKR